MIKTGNSKTCQQVPADFCFYFNFFGPIHEVCKVHVCELSHVVEIIIKGSDIRIQKSGESLRRLVPNKLLLRESQNR